jgi:riboflavin transporter FmnP
LAKRSWQVLRSDRSLIWFPIVAAIASLGAAALIFGPAAALYSQDNSEAVLVVGAIIGAYVLTFIAVFFNTALAAAAAQSLAGRDTSMSDGIAAARGRMSTILQWALVQATVGLLLQAVESWVGDSLPGRILAGLVNFAWSAATFFVIPIIALEGLGPRDAFKRSVSVLRQRWGEGAVGTVSISGIVMLVVLLPVLAFGGLGYTMLDSAEGFGIGLIVVAAAVLVAGFVVAGTLNAIFRVALYQYATQEQAPAGFDAATLQGAFGPKRRRGLLR